MKPFHPSESGLHYPVTVQPKLDGVSCILGTDGLYRSRTNKYFPAVQASFGGHYPPYELHGELYCHGWSLQRIIAAVTPDKPTEDTEELTFFIWDSIAPEGLVKRLMAAERGMATSRHAIIPIKQAECATDIYDFYHQCLAMGFEGAVIRDFFGTTRKLKPYHAEEFLCTAVEEGVGKRQGHVGKFVLQLPDGRTFRCGGGHITYRQLADYLVNPPLGKLITVRFNSKSDDGIPLCAQFVSVRDYE